MKSKVAALSLILLAACGGGGTSTEPTKAPEADIVIPEGVSNTVAIDLLTTKIAKILEEARNSK